MSLDLVVGYDGRGGGKAALEEGISLAEKMGDALSEVGMFAEQCTGWYSGIYNI